MSLFMSKEALRRHFQSEMSNLAIHLSILFYFQWAVIDMTSKKTLDEQEGIAVIIQNRSVTSCSTHLAFKLLTTPSLHLS